MSSVDIIYPGEHKWETDEFALCQFGISAAAMAKDFEIPLAYWDEDGLGKTCGFGCRLSSGLVILVQEHQAIMERTGQGQCTIHVDAADFCAHGPDTLVAELIALFGLSKKNLLWVQPIAALGAARTICELATSRREQQVKPAEI